MSELPDKVFPLSEFTNRNSRGSNEHFLKMMESSQSFQGQSDAFIWFTKSQLRSVIRNGIVPEWFHGIISRKMAEELLMPKPPGYFLIRVSESRIGYSLSYRAEDRCRHFMIDALEDGQYIIVGENRCHQFLQDLVDFHQRTPIMPFSEVLTIPCGQMSNDKTDYAELLFPQRHLNQTSDTSLLPNSFQPPSINHPISQEDIPPALPYRPNNLTNSAVLSPNSQPNSLYLSLGVKYPHVASPLQDKPVPLNKNRHTADNTPSNYPPEVPARSFIHPPKNHACIRTVSAPESPSTPTATEHQFGTNSQSVKNQEVKPSVVTNLKNLKKKFQKKRSMSQEAMYTEINVGAVNMSGKTENEYQELTGEKTFNSPPFSHTDMGFIDAGLPQEYLPPPPFAPGY